ncbi:MAG: glycerophosphodiester phosphodiesterase [Deltaproteobacteria bacterium]|nr:glycerophosphodiester phosphodiesterase [Deltaproteobacteria bacterium]
MKILAHRGASARATENTLAAFALARREGADGIELDVRLCGSGEVVVFHDATLERLTGDPRRVAALSLSHLRALRLPGGERIPTLAEAYEAAGPDLLVNVELKVTERRPTGLEEAVARVIADLRVAERTLISCFHPAGLWRIREHAPRLPRGLLFGTEQHRLWRRGWQGLGAGLSALHPEASLVGPARMRLWRSLGLAVNVWTVDDAPTLRRLAALGVDAVITNDPAFARSVLI